MRRSTIKYTCSRFGGSIEYTLSHSFRVFRTRWMECRSNGSHLASAKRPTPSGRRSLWHNLMTPSAQVAQQRHAPLDAAEPLHAL